MTKRTAKKETFETRKHMFLRLGIPVCTVSTYNTLCGLSPIQCYVKPYCRWLFGGMCYCPMPEKYGNELAYPIHFLYRKCRGKYREWLGCEPYSNLTGGAGGQVPGNHED